MVQAKPISETSAEPSEDSGPVRDDEVARLKAQLGRLRRYVAELEHTADTDPLLPIYNRRAFMRELSRGLSVFERYEIPCAVIYMDLDGFKSVNDRYGHAVGDDILAKVSGVLNDHTRACDMVARLGGDEFGVILFKCDAELAESKAAALNARLSDIQVNLPTAMLTVSMSWGIAVCQADDLATDLLSRADLAMFDMKRNKRAMGVI